jgi:hypothetical protein
MVLRRARQTLRSGALEFIEPSSAWEVVALSAVLELADGVEAQPATVDATRTLMALKDENQINAALERYGVPEGAEYNPAVG